MECPGCGSQTAFIYLLKGDFEQALLSYPPLVLFVILFVLLALHLSFRFRNGGNLLKYFSILTLLSVLINFVYKQTLHG